MTHGTHADKAPALGVSSDVRQMAWDVLVRATPDEAFVPVLLGDLLNHPDEHVRSSSANALEQPVGSPDVQEALERALNDPSMDVRRAASGVLERAGR